MVSHYNSSSLPSFCVWGISFIPLTIIYCLFTVSYGLSYIGDLYLPGHVVLNEANDPCPHVVSSLMRGESLDKEWHIIYFPVRIKKLTWCLSTECFSSITCLYFMWFLIRSFYSAHTLQTHSCALGPIGSHLEQKSQLLH